MLRERSACLLSALLCGSLRFVAGMLACAICLSIAAIKPSIGLTQSTNPVTVVPAASFKGALAPESIAAAFGPNLATSVELASQIPLPTSLAGTTVKINGREAPLFFVAPEQINFLVPKETAPGVAAIEVRTGNGVISRGEFQVRRATPAIFTANTSGAGVVAAVLLRFRNGENLGFEPLSRVDPALNRHVFLPIDLRPETDQVFLIFYLSGVRGAGTPDINGNVNEAVRVILGGIEYKPAYAGPAPGFVGLDQINLELSREMGGLGQVSLSVTTTGLSSNEAEIEIASQPGPSPPRLSNLSSTSVLAGETLVINGSGFSANPADNVVRIGGLEARVKTATTTQLSVEIPFGAKTGKVSVKTSQGEVFNQNELAVRTSISGFVTDTSQQPQPLRGVTITAKIGGVTKTTRTTDSGSFILPDLPADATLNTTALILIDGSTVPSALPYPILECKFRVVPRQDNPFVSAIALQQVTGANNNSAIGSLAAADNGAKRAGQQLIAQNPIKLQTGDVILEIPTGATITYPENTPNRTLGLTIVDQSRAPANLPAARFSQRIVQITPFGTKITPGAKLTFPNPEGFTATTQIKLFRFEKNNEINIQDGFIEAGTVSVSNDGQRIETAVDAVKETSYYFVAASQQTTVAIGRVVEGSQPVRQAIVQVRGQNDFTDGNGGFSPRDVSVKQGDTVQAEASFQRANGRVDFTIKGQLANVSGLTDFGKIPLNQINTNRPPVLLIPPQVVLTVGETREVKFTAYDPDNTQQVTIQPRLTPQGPNANPNPGFAEFTLNVATGEHTIRLSPKANDVGEYALTITVEDNAEQKLSLTKAIAISVLGAPGVFTAGQNVRCDATAPSGPAVTLSWSRAERALTYDIVRNNAVIKENVVETSYTDKAGVIAGGDYTYQVIARNPAGINRSNALAVKVPDSICASTPITASFGVEAGDGRPGGTIFIPVVIGDLTSRGVIAYEFDLVFNASVLEFVGVEQNNTLSESMTVITNPNGGLLRLAAFTSNQLSGSNRTLLTLKFKVTGARGATTDLIWQKFLLNEGEFLQSAIKGSFTVK